MTQPWTSAAIKAFRKAYFANRADFAAALGVSYSTVCRLEQGDPDKPAPINPNNARRLTRLAAEYGYQPDAQQKEQLTS